GLLALLDAGVPGEEALLLQLGAELRLDRGERTGDAVSQRAGLARDAAAVQAGVDVEALVGTGGDQRPQRLGDQDLAAEELIDRAAVADDLAGARGEGDTGDRRLALTGGANALPRGRFGAHEATSATRVRRSGSGCWAVCGCSGPA